MTGPVGTLVMTGGTRGLGLEAATRLLRGRPELHLLLIARGDSGAALTERLIAQTANPNVSTLACDLTSMQQMRTVIEALGSQLDSGTLPPLRGFLGNAGVQLTSAARPTADGFETTFGVNVLANFMFVRLLLDRFTSPARIVLTTSATHFGDIKHNYGMIPGPRWEDVERLAMPRNGPRADTRTEGYTAYATSKLALVYLVHALSRRLPQGVDAYSHSPGLVPGTGIVRDSSWVSRLLFSTVMPLLQLNAQVAMGPTAAGARLASTFRTALPGPSGSYIDRGKVTPSSTASYDPAREEALWHTAERMCAF